MKRRTGHIFKISMITLAIVAILECSCRLYDHMTGWEAPDPFINIPETQWCRPDPVLKWVMEPNSQEIVFEMPVTVGDQGLRCTDFGKKPENTFRVLTLGDSVVFGYQVTCKESFAGRLGPLLEAAIGSGSVEVIAAGVPGYTSYQGLRWLERWGARTESDLIVAAFSFNDRRRSTNFLGLPDGPLVFLADYIQLQAVTHIHPYASHLSFYRHLFHAFSADPWSSRPMDLDRVTPRVPPDRFVENLREIGRFGAKHKIPCLFFILPDNPDEIKFLRLAEESFSRSGPREALRMIREHDPFQIFTALQWKKEIELLRRMGDHKTAERRLGQYGETSLMSFGGNLLYEASVHWKLVSSTPDLAPLLIDLDPVLPDGSFYLDFCHPGSAGHRAIARTLAGRITAIVRQ